MFKIMIKTLGIKEIGEIEYTDYEDALKDAKLLVKYSDDGCAFIYSFAPNSLFGVCTDCIMEG